MRTNQKTGTLYVVATPIGNPDDITVRALRILEQADVIASEDTRNTGRLLAAHGIKNTLVSFHEHNEIKRSQELVDKMKNGLCVALVSDAGTPSVSDPGYRLVNEAVAGSIRVVPMPGPSAAITALSASGLPTDTFCFAGFPPKKKAKRLARLETLAHETGTIIFYESPRRVIRLIEELIDIMGLRNAVLCREMTKPYEEFIRGSLEDIHAALKKRKAVKGECTLLVAGRGENRDMSSETLARDIKQGLKDKNAKPSELAAHISKKHGLSRKHVYDEILKIQKN